MHIVDRYLGFVYKNISKLSDIEYQNTVVWGGAYVGEVIRRNAALEYHWLEYEDYMKTQIPELRNMLPLMLSTHALLVENKTGHMTLPMNKVARCLGEGSEHNVHFYASPDISRKG